MPSNPQNTFKLIFGATHETFIFFIRAPIHSYSLLLAPKFYCGFDGCLQSFRTALELTQHTKAVHPSNQRHACPECGKVSGKQSREEREGPKRFQEEEEREERRTGAEASRRIKPVSKGV
jgi:hypothetical protein